MHELLTSPPRLSISTGTIVRFFLVAIALIALYYISDIVVVILAAVIFASAIEPIVRRIQLYKVPRFVAVLLIYIVIAAALAGMLIFFVPIAATDAVSFLGSLPQTLSLENIWNVGAKASAITPHVSTADFINELQSFVVGTSEGAFQTATAIFGGVLSFLLIVVLSFYLTVQENGVANFLRIVTPVRHHEYIINLWKRSQRKIGFWLQGQIMLGIIVGVLVYVVLVVVGIPHALLLAIFAAMLEIIPVFGPIIAAVPAVLVAFVDVSAGKGVLLIVLYLIIHQFENQLFYPLVVKKVVGMSPIVVIISLVIGAKLAGVIGALIAVPLSAVLMEYVNDLEKYKNAEIAERMTVGKES